MLHIIIAVFLARGNVELDYLGDRARRMDSVLERSYLPEEMKMMWKVDERRHEQRPDRTSPAWVWIEDEDRSV